MENVADEVAETKAIFLANSCSPYLLTDFPPMSTSPELGLSSLLQHFTNVVFPTPLGPRMHTNPGSSKLMLISSRMIFSSYPKVMFW